MDARSPNFDHAMSNSAGAIDESMPANLIMSDAEASMINYRKKQATAAQAAKTATGKFFGSSKTLRKSQVLMPEARMDFRVNGQGVP